MTRYNMRTFGDLFAARQKLALVTLGKKVNATPDPTRRVIALTLGRLADFNSSVARWAAARETSAATFGRQALPMMWDFCETAPIGDSTGSLFGSIGYVATIAGAFALVCKPNGHVEVADAQKVPLPDESADVWFTDPPYYDAIPYADLSDFFFVWLKRALPDSRLLKDPHDSANPLTPKISECVWNQSYLMDGHAKDGRFFEKKIGECFRESRRILGPTGIGAVVFAHQTTEGWEALLSGLVTAGWTVSASWPIATERTARVRAIDTASLATSIHLVCRPRPEDADIGDWADVLRELPNRIGDWMERLSSEGVRGADLVFACIGPAMEIYTAIAASRMPKVAKFLSVAIPKQASLTNGAFSRTYGKSSDAPRWARCSAPPKRAPAMARQVHSKKMLA